MASPNPNPLVVPSSLMRPPGLIERASRYVPLLGWIVANELEKSRQQPALDALAQQLLARNGNALGSRFPANLKSEFVAFVARSIKQHFGWPNDYFLPDDPLELLFFGEEGAGVCVFNDIAESMGIPSGTFSSEFIDDVRRRTFGDALVKILEVGKGSQFPGEPSS